LDVSRSKKGGVTSASQALFCASLGQVSAIATLRREAGLGILLVDKTLRELAAVADRGVILDKGRTVWSGPMGGLDAGLAARWLGV
jgi:ABC-type branched-subunit amino acid transport system ATPase component